MEQEEEDDEEEEGDEEVIEALLPKDVEDREGYRDDCVLPIPCCGIGIYPEKRFVVDAGERNGTTTGAVKGSVGVDRTEEEAHG